MSTNVQAIPPIFIRPGNVFKATRFTHAIKSIKNAKTGKLKTNLVCIVEFILSIIYYIRVEFIK